MKLEQLSFADLIALRQELKDRIRECHYDRYLVLAGKKKNGPNRDELQQMADNHCDLLDAVKAELDRRISIIEF